MPTFKVFQIEMTDELHRQINSLGWSDPKNSAYLDATFGKPEKAIRAGMYSHVATIEAEDLEDVFRIGNIGPGDKIIRLRKMTSISVGNLIQDQDGNFHVVADFGFQEIVPEGLFHEGKSNG